MHDALRTLQALRERSGPRQTPGLSDHALLPFLQGDPRLTRAIARAERAAGALQGDLAALIALDESLAIGKAHEGYVNFYSSDATNPYLALAADGPWIVTTHGAVIHDSGGYGMLGFGHAPQPVLEALAAPWVQANIMTASPSQARFDARLRQELGHTRAEGCPFDRFVCMNSGSEAVTVGMRICDVNARRQTDPGGPHQGKPTVFVVMERAFHGRTDRPAQLSHSTRPVYERHLASYRQLDNLWTVPYNDIEALKAIFDRANREGVFIEAVLIEPVQGEGAPGRAMTRAFYDTARALTFEHGTLLLIDSIQAGLRAWGVLSLVDYPGFEDAPPPDIETWSKALNAGQYPLSVLGLTSRAADLYVTGIYGNTMTGNPRGLEVACAVLNMITPEIRQNIREQGCAFVGDLQALAQDFPHLITQITGTGLLFAAELNPEHVKAIGPGSAEERCRRYGMGVIHGGRNALRFTPHFGITDEERALVMSVLRQVLTELDEELQHAAK
ncbi:MAG: aminotransferase class III-fold pyridoxal phosphate-dependent enzyme [Deltaproteobacteria bacterium]|nr:MAG: aminotransferase class III-fold pyridoxal phosphate-dependent enzyme [Deltaproteobacteria bacterium]